MIRSARATRVLRACVLGLAAFVTASALAGCWAFPATVPRATRANDASASHVQTWTIPASDIVSSTVTTPALPVAGKVEPPAHGAYLGVYVPPAPFDMTKVAAYSKTVGRDVSIVMWYQPWEPGNRWQFDAGACIAVMRAGKVPMITWEPWNPGANANNVRNPGEQSKYALKKINSGVYDAYIRDWARQMKALGGPIMLRPMHEMNGNWYPWSGTTNGNSPSQYVAAWRHIHDIFVEEGATNVTWVWSVNHESVPGIPRNSYGAYYPGDAYVDWTSMSGFNWGTSSPYSAWQPFLHWYAKPLAYLKTLGKPICISEFATVEQGGDKAAWIADAYSEIAGYSQVKAVIYYSALEKGKTSKQDWRANTSPQSVAAFRKVLASDYWVSTPPAVLTQWGDSLTTDQWEYLSSIAPLY